MFTSIFDNIACVRGTTFGGSKRMMKGTGNNYTIPPLYNGSTGELVYEDKAKADRTKGV
jgi:hypothetical protein